MTDNPSDIVAALAAIFSVITAFYVFFVQRKDRKLDVLLQSFDILQRIHEKALDSNKHLIAAIRSCNPDDSTTVEEARKIYFHYMRINRIFRAYELARSGFLSQSEADRIVKPQLRTLVSILPKLSDILGRGYPEDFADYLIESVAAVSISSPITR